MNKKFAKKIFRNTFSFLLVFILVFTSVSSGVFATSLSNDLGKGMTKIDKNKRMEAKNVMPKAADTPVELKQRRTKHSKEFLNPDGTFTVEISKKPIHYKDNRGHFQKIDNTLVNINKGVYKYENKENGFKVRFAPNNQSDKLVQFSLDEEHWLEISPVGKFDRQGNANNSVIEYKNFKPNMDLKYIVDSTKLKEEIILHKYPNTNTFTFNISYNGLILEKDEEGTIWGKDEETGKKLFHFQKSFAIDANDNITYDAQLDIVNQNGKETLVLTVNDQWLQNAAYPVIVDPTIETSTDKNSADTYVASDPSKADSNFYLSSHLHAGQLSGYGTMRSFIKFKYLPSLAPGAKIKNAYLSAHMHLAGTAGTTIDVCEVLQPWESSTTTWNQKPDADYSNPIATAITATPNTVWQFDIKSLVEDWYSGTKENYGVALKATNELSDKLSFFSGDASGQVNPTLTIEYEVDPLGSEAFYGFDGNVNVHNGNLSTSIVDVTLPGRGIPIAISRTYNSRAVGSSILGDRWALNYGMKLDFASDENVVVLTDGDGTTKAFVKSDANGNYTSPVGVKLTIKKDTQTNTFYLEERSGIKYYFTTAGKLDKMEDTNGNITDVGYNLDGNIDSITDPSGRIVNFNYTNGKLTSITGNEITTVEYVYNGDYLTQVKQMDGSTVLNQVTYGYDGFNNIYTVKDNDNNITSIFYSYTTELGLRVQRIEKKLTINSIQETLTTSYVYAEDTTGDGIITTVTNPKLDITEYTTNKMGNVVKVAVDKNGKNLITTFSWDENQNLVEVKDPMNLKDPNNYKTTIEYNDKDEVSIVENSKGERISYDYDDDFNVTEVVDPSGRPSINNYDSENRNLLGSSNPLFSTSVIDYDNNGNVTSQYNPMGIGDNHVGNNDFEIWGSELPFTWEQVADSGGSIDSDTVEKINGENSVKLQSNGSLLSQQAKLQSDYINVEPSTKYNVSWYVKNSSAATNANATVEVLWFDSAKQLLSGETTYNLATTKGEQDWTRKSARINSPEYTGGSNDAKYAKVVILLDDQGTAWFDNIQFEQGSAINNHNLLVNESMEIDFDSTIVTPDNWDPGTLGGSDGVTTLESHTGGKSVLINGDVSNKHFGQQLNISGVAGTPLHFSGWSKSEGVAPTGGYYQVLLEIDYTDPLHGVDWIPAEFSRTNDTWQYIDKVAIAKYDFDSVTVYGKLENQNGAKAWFDDFSLSLHAGSNALISSYNIAQNSNFEYDRDSSIWPDNWERYSPSSESKMIWQPTSSEEKAYSGNYMIKISDVSGISVVSTLNKEPIKAGQTYTASAVIKTDNVTGSGAILKFNILDANGSYLTQKVLEKPIDGTSDWTRVVLSISEDEAKTLHPNAAKLTVSVGTIGATTGTMYFDAVRFNEANLETKLHYDTNKNYIEKVTNQKGNSITYTNDNRGNVETITDPKLYVYSFTYDKLDRIKTASNPKGLTTKYFYHANGDTDRIENHNATGKYNTAITKNYNELGIVNSIKDGLNRETTLEYDKNANLTDINYPNGKGIHYDYDTANRLTDIQYVNSGTDWNFQYDDNGNVTFITKDTVQTIENIYDKLDRIDKIKFTQVTEEVDYDYNPSGQVVKIINSKLSEKDIDNEIVFEYDQGGNPVGINAPNGIDIAYMFDEQGKINKSYLAGSGYHYLTYKEYNDIGSLSRYKVEKATGDIIIDYQYEYDKNGNRTAEIDNISNTRIKYDYDEINQLTAETHYDTIPEPDVQTKKITYGYDILGNRTLSSEEGGATYNFEYDKDTNEVTKLNGVAEYTHDANGNLTKAFEWDYIYNDADQLMEVKQSGVTKAKYEYNADGLRTKKELVQEGKTELYYYNGDKLVYITDGSHNLKYFFLRDIKGKSVNMIDYSGATPVTYWYLYDGHGNVVGLSDKNGNEVASYEYDAWGSILSQSSTVTTGDGTALWKANPFRYSGYQYDDETGIYYLKSRYYSPFLGRFITKDAILAINLYRYTANNPVNYIDPSGYYRARCEDEGITKEDDDTKIEDPTAYSKYVLKPLTERLVKNYKKLQREPNNVEKATVAVGMSFATQNKFIGGTIAGADQLFNNGELTTQIAWKLKDTSAIMGMMVDTGLLIGAINAKKKADYAVKKGKETVGKILLIGLTIKNIYSTTKNYFKRNLLLN